MKSNAVLIFLFCCLSGLVSAQKSILVSGKIQDKDKGKPLAGASVTLKGQTISTVANDEGEFNFYVPDSYINDTLHISVMGYESYVAAVSTIAFQNTQIIRLRRSAVSLQEITITETLTPQDILNLAIERIPLNYYSQPFIQQAFYREVQCANGQYVSLTEAALEIYNKDHRQRGQHLKVLQLRKSKAYQHVTNPFWNTYNVLLSSMALNTVGYITKKSLNEYSLQREADTTLDSKAVFVLTSSTPALWPVKFYIQCDNYAFVRIEEMYDVNRDGIKSWKQHNSDTVHVFAQKRAMILEYKPLPKKYSLSTLSFSVEMIYRNAHTDNKIFQFEIQQDLMVNDIQSSDVRPMTKSAEVKRNLQDETFVYDPDFWKTYNIIKETPLHQRIRNDLEKDTTLEEQFRNKETTEPANRTKRQ